MNDTRAALVSTAERLFIERGTDVSLHDITVASGSRNKSAIQYHFGGRSGLLRAVVDKHERGIEERRHRLLDSYEAEGAGEIRVLAAALVEPLADELSNADGGPGYLQLVSDIYNRPRFRPDPATAEDPASSIYRWRGLIVPHLEADAIRLHRRFDALRITTSELARRARAHAKDQRLFTSQLTDLVVGLLLAPVSEQTRAQFR